MRVIDGIIGVTIGTMVLTAGPALAAPAGHSSTIRWTTADAVAAERVPGSILSTRLEDDDGRALYAVVIHTGDNHLEEVHVDALSGRVLSVDELSDPGQVGEIQAP